MVILHIAPSNVSERVLFMFSYGYLFGFIRLIKDSHHDEVFIERNGVVVMQNGIWLLTYDELIAIARDELNYGKVTVIDWRKYNG